MSPTNSSRRQPTFRTLHIRKLVLASKNTCVNGLVSVLLTSARGELLTVASGRKVVEIDMLACEISLVCEKDTKGEP